MADPAPALPERKFALHRIGTGDYICWSNDEQTIWRFVKYEDGAYHGLIDVDYELRTFWMASYVPVDVAKRRPEILESDYSGWDAPWILAEQHAPSRTEAIKAMLKGD